MLLAAVGAMAVCDSRAVAAAAAGNKGPVSCGADPDHRLTIPPASSIDAPLIERLFACGDVRIIALGDSFAAPVWNRVFPSVLRVWPHGPLTAVAGGASTHSQLVQGVPRCAPSADIQGGPGTYEVLRGEPTPAYFTLPMRGMTEIQGSPALTAPGGDLLEVRLWDGSLAGAPGGRLTEPGVTLAFRMLFWAPPEGLGVARVALRFGDAPEALIDLVGPGAVVGQINAAPGDAVARFDQPDDKPVAMLREVDALAGSGRYLHPAGGVFSRVDCEGQRVRGLYYSSLSDVSWSYAGFAADRAGAGPKEKSCSREQVAAWARATTLDPDQPVVVFWYLAAEPMLRDEAESVIETMLDVASSALTDAGVPSVTHCMVLPHFHSVGSFGVSDAARERVEAQRDAMFAIAQRRDDAAAISLYDLTHGVLFDGSADARAWLAARGFDRFEYAGRSVNLVADAGGNLLDGSRLHPSSEDAAALFASVLSDAIAP